MNPTHTRGPWIVTPDPYGIGDAMIGTEGGKPDQVACCALKDAALIAAAPDMAEALKELFDAEMEKCMLWDGKEDQIAAIAKARAALAKAGA